MCSLHLRPLATGCVLYLTGMALVILSRRFDLLWPLAGSLFALFALLALILSRKRTTRPHAIPLGWLSFCCLLLLLRGTALYQQRYRPAECLPDSATLQVTVGRDTKNGVTHVVPQGTDYGIALIFAPEDMKKGERWQVSVTVLQRQPASLEELSQGILINAQVEHAHRLESATASLPEQWHLSLSQSLASLRHAPLARALLLGDSSQVDPAFREDLRSVQASHILAISGLHVTLLLAALQAILRRLGLTPRGQALFLVSFCLFYCTLLGFTPSVCRAALMAAVVFVGKALRRSYDSRTSLALAATLLCLADPAALFSLSFRLSFLATLGIVSLAHLFPGGFFQKRLGPRSPRALHLAAGLADTIAQSTAVSFSALLFSLPVVLELGPSLNLLGLLGNLMLLQLFTPGLIAAFACLVCRWCLPFLWGLLAPICDTLLELLYQGAQACARWDTPLTLTGPLTQPAVCLLGGVLVAILALWGQRFARAKLALALAVLPLCLALHTWGRLFWPRLPG